MNKGLLIFLGVIILLVCIGGCGYNGMNSAHLDAKESWANLQSQYQRRLDLLPNIAATVKSSAKFEQSTLVEIAQARASASQIKVSADDLTPEKAKQISASQGQLSQTLGRLLMTTEQYPELKSVAGFQDLRVSIEGCEDRIQRARTQYNATVKLYNEKTSRFPNVILAGILGFKQMPNFEADADASKAPSMEKALQDQSK